MRPRHKSRQRGFRCRRFSPGSPSCSSSRWLRAFVTGLYFAPAALLAAAYVVFLGFAFHGPDRWEANQNEFGFFIDHFTFMAGLLYAAAHGPGRLLTLRRRAAAAAREATFDPGPSKN